MIAYYMKISSKLEKDKWTITVSWCYRFNPMTVRMCALAKTNVTSFLYSDKDSSTFSGSYRSQECVFQEKDSYKEFWPRSYYSGFENWRWAKRGHAYQSRIHCTSFFHLFIQTNEDLWSSLCAQKLKSNDIVIGRTLPSFLWAFSFVRLKKISNCKLA